MKPIPPPSHSGLLILFRFQQRRNEKMLLWTIRLNRISLGFKFVYNSLPCTKAKILSAQCCVILFSDKT